MLYVMCFLLYTLFNELALTAIVGHLELGILRITHIKPDGEAVARNYTLNERVIRLLSGKDVKLKPNAGTELITAFDVDAKLWKQIILATTQWDIVELVRALKAVPKESVADLRAQLHAAKLQVVQLGGTLVNKPGGPKLGSFTLNTQWYVERAKKHILEQRKMRNSDFDLTKTPDPFQVENIVFRLWKDMKAKLNADDMSFGQGYYSIKDAELDAVHKIALLFHK